MLFQFAIIVIIIVILCGCAVVLTYVHTIFWNLFHFAIERLYNVYNHSLQQPCVGTQNGFAETYAPGSRCVEHGSVQWVAGGYTYSPQGAGCYQVRCFRRGIISSWMCESKNLENWFDLLFCLFCDTVQLLKWSCDIECTGSGIHMYSRWTTSMLKLCNFCAFPSKPIQCYLIFPD